MRLLPLLLLVACHNDRSFNATRPGEVPADTDVEPEPIYALAWEPTALAVGPLAPGEEAAGVLDLVNTGDAPVTVHELVLEGGEGFSIGVLGETVLEPGASVPVDITFITDGTEDQGALLTAVGRESNHPVAELMADVEYVPEAIVQIRGTADDSWRLWLDGEELDLGENQHIWNQTTVLEVPVVGAGEHVLALHAWDQHRNVSAARVEVSINGTVYSATGDGSWNLTRTEPPTDWLLPGFDDSAWPDPVLCTSTAWGVRPEDLQDSAALWVWSEPTCADLGDAWMRLPFAIE